MSGYPYRPPNYGGYGSEPTPGSSPYASPPPPYGAPSAPYGAPSAPSAPSSDCKPSNHGKPQSSFSGYSQPPPSGYSQLPPSGYSQPPRPSYSNSPASGYPQPPSSGYSQSPSSGYSQPYSQQPPSSGYSQSPSSGYSQPYSQQPPSSGYSQSPSSGYSQTYSQQPPTSGYTPPSSYSQPPPSGYSQPPPSGYSQPPSTGYGHQPSGYSQSPSGYPPQSAAAAFPPGTDPNVIACFQVADQDGSGFIDDIELQRALSSYNQSFSIRTVHLLMYLFTNTSVRKIGPKEFTAVFYSLQNWRVIFERFDRDRSGKIDQSELREALLSLGFAVSPAVLDLLVSKFDKSGGRYKAIEYDNFIECCLTVKGLTEKFREKDTSYSGTATFNYESFMMTVLPFLVA